MSIYSSFTEQYLTAFFRLSIFTLTQSYFYEKAFSFVRHLHTPFTTNAQWTFKNPSNIAVNSYLTSVFLTGPSVGYVVGSYNNIGLLLKTTDGGDTWTNNSIASGTSTFQSIFFAHLDTGYVAGNSLSGGVMFKTTDGGNTWNALPTIPGAVFSLQENLQFINPSTGFVNGSHGSVFRTTDGGSTWSSIKNAAGASSIYGMSFTSSDTGYVVGTNPYGGINKTTDGGANWVTQSHPTTTALNSCSFINANIGCAVGNAGTILKTTDGGVNWIQQTSGTIEKLKDVYFIDALNGVIVGDNGTILKTNDGGTNWYMQSSNTTADLNDAHFYDSNVGYTVASNRTILKTTNGGNFPSSIDELVTEKIGLTVYPNPSKSLFVLTTKANISEIQVENLEGRIIHSKIVSGNKIELDLVNYPSGVYVLRVNTTEGKIARKITLRR